MGFHCVRRSSCRYIHQFWFWFYRINCLNLLHFELIPISIFRKHCLSTEGFQFFVKSSEKSLYRRHLFLTVSSLTFKLIWIIYTTTTNYINIISIYERGKIIFYYFETYWNDCLRCKKIHKKCIKNIHQRNDESSSFFLRVLNDDSE